MVTLEQWTKASGWHKIKCFRPIASAVKWANEFKLKDYRVWLG